MLPPLAVFASMLTRTLYALPSAAAMMPPADAAAFIRFACCLPPLRFLLQLGFHYFMLLFAILALISPLPHSFAYFLHFAFDSFR